MPVIRTGHLITSPTTHGNQPGPVGTQLVAQGLPQNPLAVPQLQSHRPPPQGHFHPYQQLRHPPGTANAARLSQAFMHAAPAPGISGAAWKKVSNANPLIVTTIADQMETQGLGHAVRGSKPVFHFEGSEEEGVWQEFRQLTQGKKLQDNFQLISVTSNRSKPAERHVGYLINRSNLLRVIDQHKDFFAAKFGVSDLSNSRAMLDECVIPHLRKLDNEAFADEQEFLAITLGYGRSNANAGDTARANEFTEQTSQQVDQWMAARGAQKESSYPLPQLPPFKKYPSAESRALIKQYMADSDAIHTHLSALLEQHEPPDDLDDLEVADARVVVAALLTALMR